MLTFVIKSKKMHKPQKNGSQKTDTKYNYSAKTLKIKDKSFT